MNQEASPAPPDVGPFEFQPRTRLVFGPNTLERIGELAASLGARKALLVTDPGIAAAGHEARARRLLEKAGITVACFEQVEQNPSESCVEKCAQVARAEKIDCLIGLGGGSSMDTAKGCNFVYTNGGRMKDYWGIGKAALPMLPLIAIPTTAGTGSECQSFALITDNASHQKMACGDPKAAARIAILDPTLTLSQPKRVAACTGIDAISHALESAVTKKRTPISTLFSREAFKLCVTAFPIVLSRPADLPARGRMLLGAAFAGMAIENSMLGAAHSAANPMTAHLGIVHGQAVGLLLPHVVRFNARNAESASIYTDLAIAAGLALGPSTPDQGPELIAVELERLLELAELNQIDGTDNIDAALLQELAREAAGQWTAPYNPRPVQVSDFENLYSQLWPTVAR